MDPKLAKALNEDFYIFLRKAFEWCHPSKEFRHYPYLEYLCYLGERFEGGAETRAIVTIPARHLKTFTFSKALPAWILGRTPSAEIMILTCSEGLAKHIAHAVRSMVLADWYQEAFPTRIARDRGSVLDFATTAGGECFSSPVGASFIGRGASKIILDDLVDPLQANNLNLIDEINQQFDSRIESRLNNPGQDGILYVAHRINANDLAGYLQRQGGWTTIALPWIAPTATNYEFGGKIWRRPKGELLKIDSLSEKQIEAKRNRPSTPDFETIYQQNPSGALGEPITAKHFRTCDLTNELSAPVVLSVDAGQETSAHSSFSVIQAWVTERERHYLIDQWRERAVFHELVQACRHFRRKYDVRAILIERAALGTALLSEGKRRRWRGLVPIIPNRQGKLARLVPHVPTIINGAIALPGMAEWRSDFVDEIVNFPTSKFTDQVDAMTQYLEWCDGRPDFARREPRIHSFLQGSATAVVRRPSRDRPLPTNPFDSPYKKWPIGWP
jgi:predicted phage terminase large subunit-like protein